MGTGGSGQTDRLPIHPSRGEGLGASHASCPGISKNKAAPGGKKSSTGQFGFRGGLGVGKEYLWPKSFPALELIKLWLVGVGKFYIQLCCSRQDPASPKGMDKFHPLEPRA